MFKNACLGLMTRPGPLPAHQGKSDDGILDGISRDVAAGAMLIFSEGLQARLGCRGAGGAGAEGRGRTGGLRAETQKIWNHFSIYAVASADDKGSPAARAVRNRPSDHPTAGMVRPCIHLAASIPTTTIRIALYAIATGFDRRALEAALRAEYGSMAVKKYPDVVHCLVARSPHEGQPGADAFFFDNGVVACWGMRPEAERALVRDIAGAAVVGPLPERECENDVFRSVFVLKRSVVLLSNVNDTPDFFWYAPDQLQEMLELLRAQEENRHGTRLELVVIWLIVVEVVLGVFELLDLFGVIGPPHSF
eukprot:XP_001694391.1 predicted protein [Chlamydomonas reinhardtii]